VSERRQTDYERRDTEAIALLDNAEAMLNMLTKHGALEGVRRYGGDPEGISRRYARWHQAVLDFVNTSPPRLHEVIRYQSEVIQELQRAAPESAVQVANRMKGRQIHPELAAARRAVIDDMVGMAALTQRAAEYADSALNRIGQSQDGISVDGQHESLWGHELALAFEAGHRNRELPLSRTVEMAAVGRLAKMLGCAPTADDVLAAVQRLVNPVATRDTDVSQLFQESSPPPPTRSAGRHVFLMTPGYVSAGLEPICSVCGRVESDPAHGERS